MPNRIIKESIHESEKVNRMSDFEFRLWVNLITYVDDYGRGDARPAIIKGKCFPLRERLTNADINAALRNLAGIGCINLYEVDGRSYLCFPRWESHQRVRTKVSKYPAPQENTAPRVDNQTLDRNPPQSAATRGEARLESNPNPNPNPNPLHTHRVYTRENDDGFSKFWDAYPRKSGDIKSAYREYCFALEDGAALSDMLAALDWQRQQPSWTENGGQYVPSPEKWLHNKGWTQKRPDPEQPKGRGRYGKPAPSPEPDPQDVRKQMENMKKLYNAMLSTPNESEAAE